MSFQLDRGLFQFDFTDQHAILGVGVNAEEMDIRERYTAVARLLHPDSAQWKTDTDRQLAVRLFSRLVTHAYGKLSRSSQREEQTIMLQLLSKRLLEEKTQLQIADPFCQQLYQSGADFEQVYNQILTQLVAQQYKSLAESISAINQISELNLVYLYRKQLQSFRSTPQPGVVNPVVGAAKEPAPGEPAKVSPIEGALRRADEYLSMKNWGKAVQELREATSVEPTNARAHALLGLAYLRQQQTTMAKLSINKAIQLNAKDPQVIQAKQEFDRAAGTNNSASKATAKKSEGIFGGLFGNNKK
jgi:tetratricopeptide (TPR) repeat protein